MAVDSANKDFYENLILSVLAPQIVEIAQDAVGNILSDAGGVNFTYDGITPSISAAVDFFTIASSGSSTLAKIGSMEFQGVAANSVLWMDNMYWNGSNFIYRANGYAAGIHMVNGEMHFMIAASGLAGGTVGSFFTITKPIKINADGSVTFSGNITAANLGTMSAQNANAVAITGGTIILPVSANDSNIRSGTLELQGVASGSDLIMGNLYWDGSYFQRRAADYGEALHLIDGEFRFSMVNTGATGGNTAYPGTQLLTLTSGGNTSHVDLIVPDEAYGSGWNGSNEVPTKNAVYDKIETLSSVTIAAGTYTPTLDNTTNVSSSTAYQCQYLRVGATVNVSGRADLTSSGIGDTVLGISLPVASNIGAVEDCAGVAGNDDSGSFTGGIIRGNVANDRAELYWYASSGSSRNVYFTFTYQII